MKRNSLKAVLSGKRVALSAVLCILAVGLVSGIGRNTNKNKDLPYVPDVAESTYDYPQYADISSPVSASQNAPAKPAGEKREDVLTEASAEGDVAYIPEDEEYEAATASVGEFILEWPVAGNIVMDYSMDALIYDPTLDQYRTNDSVSISAMLDTPVEAASGGTVKTIGKSREEGWYVVVDHNNGWTTTYGQLGENLTVREGDRVNSGDIIGFVAEPSVFGSALGSHVDFKVTLNDCAVDPKTAVGENVGE